MMTRTDLNRLAENLKRSAKRLDDAAVAGGWLSIDNRVEYASRTVSYERAFDDPAVATIRETTGGPYFRRNAALFADRVDIVTDAETGAFVYVTFFDADGNRLPNELVTVADVEYALGALPRAVKEYKRATEAKRVAAIVGEERVAVREAFLADLADDYRYRTVADIAATNPDPPSFDVDRGTYWASSKMTNYLTAVLKTRMAAAALDMVGWPVDGSDTPGDVGTPMPLGTALAKAVADVIGNESSSSTDYEALANAAKEVLRLA